jgi:hypothetical protein
MGMEPQSSRVELLRDVAARQGVEPSDDDLEAVQSFLDAILPELARLEEQLAPEAPI